MDGKLLNQFMMDGDEYSVKRTTRKMFESFSCDQKEMYLQLGGITPTKLKNLHKQLRMSKKELIKSNKSLVEKGYIYISEDGKRAYPIAGIFEGE